MVLRILGIAVAVWILANLARLPKEPARPPARRPPPLPPRQGEAPAAGQARAPASEVDRFLEEVNRRRRQVYLRGRQSRSGFWRFDPIL